MDVDTDADPPRLYVRNARVKARTRTVEGPPKTEAGRRPIVLTPSQVEAFRETRTP